MNFTKMHGLGNDFIVLENIDDNIQKLKELAIKLCDRHSGIGADGILIVEKSKVADIKMRIINSDGSIAEMCGNGIRCFTKYVYERGICKNKEIYIETLAGILNSKITIDNDIVISTRVNMGSPIFDKSLIPYLGEYNNLMYDINVNNKVYKASTMLMGVPHTIIYVDDIDISEVVEVGRKIEKLPLFPSGTNVNFVKIIDKTKIELRTWERGAGLTFACGTGTCASVVASYLNGMTDNSVEAILSYGCLRINYDGVNVFMEGPAEFICEGNIL